MSLSLILTRRPAANLVLKNPLATAVVNETGGLPLCAEHLPFLRGCLINAQGDDAKTLRALIGSLEKGTIYDLREQY